MVPRDPLAQAQLSLCRNTHPTPTLLCSLSPFPKEGLCHALLAVPSTPALPGHPPRAPPAPNTAPSAPRLHSATSATSQPAAVPPRGRLQRRAGSETSTFLRDGAASLPPHKGAGSLDAAPLTPRALGPNEGHVKGLAALQPSRAASGNRPPSPRRLLYRRPATPQPETRPARGLPPATGSALHRDPPSALASPPFGRHGTQGT